MCGSNLSVSVFFWESYKNQGQNPEEDQSQILLDKRISIRLLFEKFKGLEFMISWWSVRTLECPFSQMFILYLKRDLTEYNNFLRFYFIYDA